MSNLDASTHNTPYSDEELEHFKQLLLEEREEALSDTESMGESLNEQNEMTEDFSSRDHHPGDLGSEEQEKETENILRERTREKIDEIDAALERIKNKTYGVCEDTGKKIQKERLEAIPWARFSVDARKKDETDQQGPQV